MEEESSRQRRTLFLRIGASVLTFTVFVITAVSWVLTQNPTLKWAIFLPLVGAVMLLPREVRVEGLADEVRIRMRLWLSYVRVLYLLLAMFVLLGLPELLT